MVKPLVPSCALVLPELTGQNAVLILQLYEISSPVAHLPRPPFHVSPTAPAATFIAVPLDRISRAHFIQETTTTTLAHGLQR
jgi:hypothetical protein